MSWSVLSDIAGELLARRTLGRIFSANCLVFATSTACTGRDHHTLRDLIPGLMWRMLAAADVHEVDVN